MHTTPGELPEEPGVHGPERELTALRPRARPRDLVEEPADLRPGEVGVEHEPRPLADERLHAVGAEALAEGRRPPALPDDRAVDRRPRGALPHERRLALIGDPDGADLAAGHARLGERLRRRALDRRPDLPRVVLDPAGLREVLRQLGVPARPHAPVGVH